MFEPIAIISTSCILPGALSPEELWQLSINKVDAISSAQIHDWRIEPQKLITDQLTKTSGKVWSHRAGLISGFENVFNSDDCNISKEFLLQLDPMFQWMIHMGRELFLKSAYQISDIANLNVGAIIGNLSYPSKTLCEYAEKIWLLSQSDSAINQKYKEILGSSLPNSANRFTSYLPVKLLAQALNLTKKTYALDAACASSLYAIKLACDELHEHKADMMIAGGINGTDSLLLNMGFTALYALSKSGQSRPLHQQADGLIPSQGGALLLLKRLDDAIKSQDSILGVIRGIGLSNDGNSRGFLIPSKEGQIRAMKSAYNSAGILPREISWIECHATGTQVGDSTEIASMKEIFQDNKIHVGALKSNLGHTITASGAAAIINVLSGFQHKVKPPTRAACDEPHQVILNSPFEILSEPVEWISIHDRYIAAINSFGFGGNNAHFLVENYREKSFHIKIANKIKQKNKFAIVGINIINEDNRQEYFPGLYGNKISDIEFQTNATKFPPHDLKHALGQQLLILKAAQDAINDVKNIDHENTSVFIGMQSDPEVARYGFYWRIESLIPGQTQDWYDKAREAIQTPLEAAGAYGSMPNIVANRINAQFNFKAGSFSVSCEEYSGLIALQLAMRELQNDKINMAVVGAVDLSCELVHHIAYQNYYQKQDVTMSDVAIALVIKRLEDAESNNDKIYKIFSEEDSLQFRSSHNINENSQSVMELWNFIHSR